MEKDSCVRRRFRIWGILIIWCRNAKIENSRLKTLSCIPVQIQPEYTHANKSEFASVLEKTIRVIMSFLFSCPKCQQKFNLPDKYAGRKMRCKTCQAEFQLPGEQLDNLEVLPDPSTETLPDISSAVAPPPPPPSIPMRPRPHTPPLGAPGKQGSNSSRLGPWARKNLISFWFVFIVLSVPIMLVSNQNYIAAAVVGLVMLLIGLVAGIFFLIGLCSRGGGNLLGGRLANSAVKGVCGIVAVGMGVGLIMQAVHEIQNKGWKALTQSVSSVRFPERPIPQNIEPNIDLYDVTLSGSQSGSHMRVWVYLPHEQVPKSSLPCVFIAPSGSNGLTGKQLTLEDRREHLPYVKAGYAVVAYSLDGELRATGAMNYQTLKKAMEGFKEAKYGLLNLQKAMDFINVQFPEVDSNAWFTAGHSSAGSVALNMAAVEPRIKGAIAYAPVMDQSSRLTPEGYDQLKSIFPDLTQRLIDCSPRDQMWKIKSPVFLFVSKQDTVISADGLEDDYRTMTKGHINVEFRRVARGDHYQAMINEGIDAGIDWMEAHLPPNSERVVHKREKKTPVVDSTPTNSNPPQNLNWTLPSGFASPITRDTPEPQTIVTPKMQSVPTPPPPVELTPAQIAEQAEAREKERIKKILELRAVEIKYAKMALAHFKIETPKGFKEDTTAEPGTRVWTRKAPSRRLISKFKISAQKLSEYYRPSHFNDGTQSINGLTFYNESNRFYHSDSLTKNATWVAEDDIYQLTVEVTADPVDTEGITNMDKAFHSIKVATESDSKH